MRISQAGAARARAEGIASHDDGWAARDAHPSITRQGKPSAFSTELVGKYSAFEEIDLADYLAVRDGRCASLRKRTVCRAADFDAYLQSADRHADRSTIAAEGLVLLDEFLAGSGPIRNELLQRLRG